MIWILDCSNPAGRPLEGLLLRPGWQSFVGVGALPMRHGLTMGELALVRRHRETRRRLPSHHHARLVTRHGARLRLANRRTQLVNPSPNAPNVWIPLAAGTVMLEGTTLEGRGTTRPLELFGAPDIDAKA